MLGLAAVLLLALAGAGTSHADTAFADFSSSINGPPSAWSYGFGITGSTFTPYSTFSNSCFSAFLAGFSCWNTGNAAQPEVGINTTAGTISGGTVIVPTDVLHLHPGPFDDSVVRWAAPIAATFTISGSFEILDTSPTGSIALVTLNGTPLFSSLLTGPGASGGNPGQSVPFSLTGTLAAGDVLAFGVNNAGLNFNDSTGLDATIVTPEPTTLLLLGTTVAGLGLARWRQRRRGRQQP
jgi:hypothetical protein